MSGRYYTIGEMARLGGIGVRRLRFYSDRGLLPPSARSQAGYRVYSETDLARLQALLLLRRVGVGLDQIAAALTGRLDLPQVLRMRLETIDREIAELGRVAAALRAALAHPAPDIETLEDVMAMMAITEQQLRAQAEAVVARVTRGTDIGPEWRRQMAESLIPKRPENPTPEQVAAFDEVMAMLSDEDTLVAMADGVRQFWTDTLDPGAYQAAATQAHAAAAAAVAAGAAPDGPEGARVAGAWHAASAAAMGRAADAAHADWLIAQNRRFAEQQLHYVELMSLLKDEDAAAQRAAWAWLDEAVQVLRRSL